MNQLSYYLALNRINNIGPRTVIKLLKRWPDLEDMFRLSPYQLQQEGLPEAMAHAIARFDWRLLEKDFAWEKQAGHHLISWDSPEYPFYLKEIYDPPFVLYLRGQLSALESPALAMVGTRKPSVTGSKSAFYFAKSLAEDGLTIVSGLALGIDAQAHKGCLTVGGKTVAVLGTGVDVVYPRRHGHLAEQITQNGLIISEFPLGSQPVPGHFPRRNRIISGLSLATLVVEAAGKSGSLITARFALEQNRDVFAVPGSIYNHQAFGCNNLVQQGARLVTSVEDIMTELGFEINKKNQKTPIGPLASENGKLVQCIGFELTTIDQIVECSGMPLEHITCELADLELNGLVQSVPGGYIRC